tara:strand:- start:17200 stop:19116 length:1917 start_codon:yes stop_codon:yes gene_type:complete
MSIDSTKVAMEFLNAVADITNKGLERDLAIQLQEMKADEAQDIDDTRYRRRLEERDMQVKENLLLDEIRAQNADIEKISESLNLLGALNVDHLKLKGSEITEDGKNLFENITTTTAGDLKISIDEVDANLETHDKLVAMRKGNAEVLEILNSIGAEVKEGRDFMSQHVDNLSKDYDIMQDNFDEDSVTKAFYEEFTDLYPDVDWVKIQGMLNSDSEAEIKEGETLLKSSLDKVGFNPRLKGALAAAPDIYKKHEIQKGLNVLKSNAISQYKKETKSIKETMEDGVDGFNKLIDDSQNWILKEIKQFDIDGFSNFLVTEAGDYGNYNSNLKDITRYLTGAKSIDQFLTNEDLENLKEDLKHNIFNMAHGAGANENTDNKVLEWIYGSQDGTMPGGPGSNINALIDYTIWDGSETFEDAHSGWKGDKGANSASYEGQNMHIRYWDEDTWSYPYDEVGDFDSQVAQDFMVQQMLLYRKVEALQDFNNLFRVDYEGFDDLSHTEVQSNKATNAAIKAGIGFDYVSLNQQFDFDYIEYLSKKYEDDLKLLDKEYGLNLDTSEGIFDLDVKLRDGGYSYTDTGDSLGIDFDEQKIIENQIETGDGPMSTEEIDKMLGNFDSTTTDSVGIIGVDSDIEEAILNLK